MMLKPLALVVSLAAIAAPAFADPLVQANAAAQRAVNGINATRFSLAIAANCDAGPYAAPTWCAEKSEGVVGGTYRELRAPAGRRVRFQLSNLPGSWNQPSVTSRVFAIVPENAKLVPGGCPDTAVACATVPLGGEEVLWIGLEVGTYKYYDPSYVGTGYGILRVVPDAPIEE